MGLRERKKQQMREAIVAAALRLFDERGYEATTVADIAAAVDIAPRTFFGYFAAKEDVVFHDFDAVHARFASRMRDREEGETAIDALRAVIAEILEETDFEDEAERCRHRLIRDTPALRERDRALFGHFEDLLADAVARDFGLPPDSLRPRMVASAATAAMAVLQDLYDKDDGLFPADDSLPIVDELLAFLRGGIDALAEQPPPPGPPASARPPS